MTGLEVNVLTGATQSISLTQTERDALVPTDTPASNNSCSTFGPLAASMIEFDNGVAQTVDSKLKNGYYDVEDAGIIGVGNDAAVINLAVTNAIAAGKVVRGQGNYAIDAAVVISSDSDFTGATFTCDATLPVSVEIRDPGTTSGRPSYVQHRTIILPKIVASTFPYTGAAGDLASWGSRGAGVRINNCISCEVHIPLVYGFGLGVHIAATGNESETACSWNAIYYGKISNNLINLYIDPIDSKGFVNENCHFGGRFTHESPITATNIAGCYHHFIGDNGAGANAQKFFGPSIEGDNVSVHIIAKDGYNYWDGVRGEAYTLNRMQVRFIGPQAVNNRLFISTTFAQPQVIESGGAKRNFVDWGQSLRRGLSSGVAGKIYNNETNHPVAAAVANSVSPHDAISSDLISGYGYDGLFVKSQGDVNPRFEARRDGLLYFGPGSSGADAVLGRAAPGVMYTPNALNVATTSRPIYSALLVEQGAYSYHLGLTAEPTSSNGYVAFRNGNGIVGSITCSGSSTSYNTSSDYRLKDNAMRMSGALERNNLLSPVTYNWKVDGSSGEGFIAHELQGVFPDAVCGEKDAVDDDGNPIYQSVDASFLVAHLVSCVQELYAKVESLESR